MTSLLVLEQFVEFWRDHPGFQVDSFGNATFEGQVRVQCGRASYRGTTLVRIRRYGPDEGTVRLRKEADLFAVFPHVEFSAPAEEYKLRGANHVLTITGRSDKLDKKFMVSLLPADAGSTPD